MAVFFCQVDTGRVTLINLISVPLGGDVFIFKNTVFVELLFKPVPRIILLKAEPTGSSLKPEKSCQPHGVLINSMIG